MTTAEPSRRMAARQGPCGCRAQAEACSRWGVVSKWSAENGIWPRSLPSFSRARDVFRPFRDPERPSHGWGRGSKLPGFTFRAARFKSARNWAQSRWDRSLRSPMRSTAQGGLDHLVTGQLFLSCPRLQPSRPS